MPLSDTLCRSVKATDKLLKLSDGGGLTFVVKPNGTKLWQYRFKLHGAESTYSIGEYPAVGLSAAREAMKAAKVLVKAGVNPVYARQADRLANQLEAGNTFEQVAKSWLAQKKVNWAVSTYDQCLKVLETDVFPKIGKMPIRDVLPPHILAIIKAIAERGAETVAGLVHQWMSAIFRHAGANLLVDSNPVAALGLKDIVAKPDTIHRKPLTKDGIALLAKKLGEYRGNAQTIIAVKLLSITFVRTVELRMAKWAEFDLDAARWIVPAERMKKREPHIVPLSTQAVALLRQLHALTGEHISGYLFPNTRRPKGCMAATTINRALEYMGFAGKDMDVNFSGHGFRATASTILNEMGFRADVIEVQLAHKERNKTRASYNQAIYLPERIAIMQSWADLMDEYAKPVTNVVHINQVA